tara:strand:- start:1270 stop:1806 length:537 start_codon:yes stop_codon:yes gene_type:complete
MADKKLVLNNVEVSWAKLQEPATKWKSDELEYSVAIKLNDQLTALMADYKINKTVKNKESTFDGEGFIQVSLDKHTRGGWTRFGTIYDTFGNPTEDLLGNGTKINLFVSIGDSQYGNLLKLGHLSDMDQDTKEMTFDFGQVTELVDYQAGSAVIKRVAETTAAVAEAPSDYMEIEIDG